MTTKQMSRWLASGAAAAVLALTGARDAAAQAGTLSGVSTVALNAVRASTITITPAAGSLNLASITDNSVANQFPDLGVTTAWTLTGGANISLVGYFSTPAQALANGTNFIPSSRVEGKLAPGATWGAFTANAVGAAGAAGGTLTLWQQALTAATNTSTRTDVVQVRLNLLGATTVAGTYAGTLNLRAVVQ